MGYKKDGYKFIRTYNPSAASLRDLTAGNGSLCNRCVNYCVNDGSCDPIAEELCDNRKIYDYDKSQYAANMEKFISLLADYINAKEFHGNPSLALDEKSVKDALARLVRDGLDLEKFKMSGVSLTDGYPVRFYKGAYDVTFYFTGHQISMEINANAKTENTVPFQMEEDKKVDMKLKYVSLCSDMGRMMKDSHAKVAGEVKLSWFR